MKALCIPNIENLSLSIRFYDMDLVPRDLHEKESTQLLTELSNAFLASNPIHHLLTSLSYNFTCPLNYGTITKMWCYVSSFTKTFTIPLDKIPNVESLTLTTFAQTFFTRGESSIGGSGNPCSLREIRFRDCAKMNSSYILGNIIHSLKDAGAWDALERFVVEDCGRLDYETALGCCWQGETTILSFKFSLTSINDGLSI